MKRRTVLAAAAALTVTGALGIGTDIARASRPGGPATIVFDKTIAADSTWTGEARGSLDGGLRSTWLNPVELDGRGRTQVEMLWEIDTAGDDDWSAVMSGSLDEATGGVTMRGVVQDGPWTGCKVSERGQLVDPAAFRFVGMIEISTESC
jgi:hypothetical protein